MRAVLRRTRDGARLAFHLVWLCAAGRTPTEMAAFLFGSRSSVDRMVRASRAGSLGGRLDPDGQRSIAVPSTLCMPWRTRALGALRTKAPRAYGWGRPRGSCAPLAATRKATHGIEGAADTVRRWLHASGGVWKRATGVAKEDDPHRSERVARMRWQHEPLHAHEVRVLADARALHRWPQGGAAWRPQGTQAEGRTPGKHAQHALAGARHLAPGTGLSGRGPRQNHGWLRALCTLLDAPSPVPQIARLSGVVENDGRQKAKAVEPWGARPPRFAWRWLPTDCPRAHPIERAFGDVHDKGTRNHTRTRLRDGVQDGEQHVQAHGPWQDNLSRLYATPAVPAAVERIAAETRLKIAA